MGFGDNDDIDIAIKVDDGGAVKIFDKLGNELTEIKKSADKASDGFTKTQARIVTLNQGFEAAQRLGAAFGKVLGSLPRLMSDLAARGEKLASLEAGFAALGGQSEVLEQMRQRAIGLISKTDALTIANAAMTGGLQNANKHLADIADLGARLANTLGREVVPTTEALTNAIAKGEVEQLKQLGLTIDQDKAFADYAKSVGVTVEQLGELARKDAIQAAALREMQNQLATVAQVTDSVSNSQTRMLNNLSDMFSRIGKTINANTSLAKSLDQVDKSLAGSELELSNLSRGLQVALNAIIKLGAKFIDFANGGLRHLRRGFSILGDIVHDISEKRMPDYQKALARVNAAEEKERAALEQNIKGREQQKDVIQDVTDVTDKGTRTNEKHVRGLKDVNKELYKLIDIGKTVSDRLMRNTMIPVFEQVNDAFNKNEISVKQYVAGLTELRKGFIAAGAAAEDVDGVIKSLDGDMQKTTKAGFFDSFANQLASKGSIGALASGDPTTALAQQIADQMAKVFTSLTDYFVFGEEAPTGEQILGDIGGIAGNLGAAVGSFLGKGIDKIFGSHIDPETQIRRDVEKYIDDLIREANTQLVNAEGRVVPFTDLVLGDSAKFEPGSEFWEMIQAVQDVAPEIVNSFQGVFGGLSETIGGEFAQGMQIGLILLDELGGDMDNLRFLVQDLGLNYEDLENAIVDAFKSGKVSALEAESQIRDMGAAFEPGLEGAGNLSKAIQNLVEGAARGNFSIIQLRNVAVEAMEREAGSLDDLRKEIAATTNLSADQIDILMAAVDQSGVGTLEELANVSDRTAISILSAMQAMGFGFAENADNIQSRLTSLTQQLERIEGKDIPITLRVRAVYENIDKGTADSLLGDGIP